MTDKLALGAIIISAISLFHGFWLQSNDQSYDQQKNRPKLYLHFADQNDDLFYGVIIGNAGNSAAIIDRMFIATRDGLGAEANTNSWTEIARHLEIPVGSAVRTTSFNSGGAISPNKTMRIAGAMKSDLTPSLKRHIDKFDKRLVFGICYSSIFGEQFFESGGNLKKNVCSSSN